MSFPVRVGCAILLALLGALATPALGGAQVPTLPPTLTVEVGLAYDGPVLRGRARYVLDRDARRLTRCTEDACITESIPPARLREIEERWHLFMALPRRQSGCPVVRAPSRPYRIAWPGGVRYGVTHILAESEDPYCAVEARVASWFFALDAEAADASPRRHH